VKTLNYITDETPFVYVVGREYSAVQDKLREFLTLAMQRGLWKQVTSNSKEKVKVQISMPAICMQRLGMSRLYYWYSLLRAKTGWRLPDEKMRQAYEQKLRRIRYAKPIAQKCWCLYTPGKKTRLLDLFTHANERKSSSLGKKLEPHEIIPLEMCKVAEIAHRKKLTLLSFNKDYRYFTDFGHTSNYVTFRYLEDFLKDLPTLLQASGT
jgi:hypothetical protein